jgi:isoleucyl-tRNA synthetase
LHTTLTEALRDEGLGREILSRVQGLRKEMDLGFTDRIRLAIDGSERVRKVATSIRETLATETLAVEVLVDNGTFTGERREQMVDGERVVITIARV